MKPSLVSSSLRTPATGHGVRHNFNTSAQPPLGGRCGKTTRPLWAAALILAAQFLGSIAVSAETAPKVAVAAIEISPTLAAKIAAADDAARAAQAQAQPLAVAPALSSNLDGIWSGIVSHYGRKQLFKLQINTTTHGAVSAFWMNTANQKSWTSVSAIRNGNQVTLSFPGDGGRLACDFNAQVGALSVVWHRNNGRSFPFTLNRAGPAPLAPAVIPMSTAPVVPIGLGLDEIARAIELRTLDRLNKSRLFTVVEANELEAAVPPSTSLSASAYDLKDVKTRAGFMDAGIDYLLVTTIEDFEAPTIDLLRRAVSAETLTFRKQSNYRSYTGKSIRGKRSQKMIREECIRQMREAAAAAATQIYSDPQTTKQQKLWVSVRCQWFDARTGECLASDRDTFSKSRLATVLSPEGDKLPESDLFEAAATELSEWMHAKTREAFLPITVTEVKAGEITMNRGSASGLTVGKVFKVYPAAEESPASANTASRPRPAQVGTVAIRQLSLNTATASIEKDDGIAVGCELRP